jgi:hypothetical protein
VKKEGRKNMEEDEGGGDFIISVSRHLGLEELNFAVGFICRPGKEAM